MTEVTIIPTPCRRVIVRRTDVLGKRTDLLCGDEHVRCAMCTPLGFALGDAFHTNWWHSVLAWNLALASLLCSAAERWRLTSWAAR